MKLYFGKISRKIDKNHALNRNDKPWGKGSDCHISIEHLFYKEELLGTHFEKRDKSGGGEIIEFTGEKVKFAKEYVPTLAKADFEVLRPIFDFVKSKC